MKQKKIGGGENALVTFAQQQQVMVLLVITDINKASAVPYSTSSSFALEIPDGYSVPACCLHCCFRGRKQKQTLTRAVRQPDSELF